jgi:hypothetical protein
VVASSGGAGSTSDLGAGAEHAVLLCLPLPAGLPVPAHWAGLGDVVGVARRHGAAHCGAVPRRAALGLLRGCLNRQVDGGTGTWHRRKGHSRLAPLIYLQTSDLYTLSLGLQQYQSVHQTAWAYLMAASVVFVVPVAVVFLLAQRFFIRGITLTGLKM